MYKKLMMIFIVLYACVNIYFQLTSGPKFSNHHALANDNTKIEDIKRLLEFTCSDEIVIEIMEDMIYELRASRPEIPDSLWQELFLEINPNEIIGMIIPIYDKYFTHDDIRAFLQFYESPAGERYRKLMPDILKESAYLGIRYGEEIAKRIMKRLKDKENKDRVYEKKPVMYEVPSRRGEPGICKGLTSKGNINESCSIQFPCIKKGKMFDVY